METHLSTFIISANFKLLQFLNKITVWALKGAKFIILSAFFENRYKWEWNIAKSVDLKISLFTKCLRFANTAVALCDLDVRSYMWIFQFKFSSVFIPRYLKHFDLKSLFRYNFSLKSVSHSLWLVLKSITSVLATFNITSFAFSQNESFFKLLLRLLEQWPSG